MADDPNQRNDAAFLGTWSSTSDVDSFLSRFNHENNYTDGTTKLHVGDFIDIIDGTYNFRCRIAGFDLESSRKASDDTIYNNGYGIMLYPRWADTRTSGYWNTDNTTSGGYLNSLAHNKANTIATNIKNSILGSHLVNRNVLLSSSIGSNGSSNAYTWTTAYGVLPSVGQFRGTYAENNTRYDDGEANYKLPLFNYHFMIEGVDRWCRNILAKENSNYNVYYLKKYSELFDRYAANYTSCCYDPLLYIR